MSPRFFSLRTSTLNGAVSRPKPVGEIGGTRRGPGGDGREHGAGPRSVRAGAIEAVQPTVDLGAVGGGEVGGGGQHRPWVGFVDPVELHAVHGELGVAAELADEGGRIGEAGAAGVGVGDRRRVDDLDRIDLDQLPADDPVPGAVAVAGDDLAAFPPPERDGHAAVDDERPEPGLEQHDRSVGLLNLVAYIAQPG